MAENSNGCGCVTVIIGVVCAIFLWKIMHSGIKINFTHPAKQTSTIYIGVNKDVYNKSNS